MNYEMSQFECLDTYSPGTGGVAVPSKNCRRPLKGTDGVVILIDHPVCAFKGGVAAAPPSYFRVSKHRH